jgi:hypothetical protein
MSLLKSIQGGRIGRAQRVVIYAPEGLGKTTLASQFPSPLFFDFEGGTHHLDVQRVEPKSLAETEATLTEISRSTPAKLGFQTVVIDTIDWLEGQIIDAVCAENKQGSIESFGYGKGYVFLAERVTKVLALLDGVKLAGFHVVLLAHSEVKKLELPDAAGAYDRYQLKLEKKVEPLIKEWADAVLFGNWKTRVAEKGENKFKAVGGKERTLYCNHTAAWDAKNRYGLKDEETWSIDTISRGFEAIGAPWSVLNASPAPAATTPAPAPASAAPAVLPEGKVLGPAKAKEAPAPAVRRDQEPDADQIPGIEPQLSPEQEELQKICGKHAAGVNAFLLKGGKIAQGQTFLDVPADYRARILKRPAEFLKAAGVLAPQAAAA